MNTDRVVDLLLDIDPFVTPTQDHTSYSGTAVSASPAPKPSKIPEMAFTSTADSPTTFRQTTPSSVLGRSMGHLSEREPSTVAMGSAPAAAAVIPSRPSSNFSAGPPPEDVKLQDAAFVDPSVLSAAVRSEPSVGQSPILPPSPYSFPGSPSASEYTPSEAPITPAPADAEASRAPWYAPPERESRAQSLLRILSSRNRPPPRRQPTHDVDSGLRLYNEATLPPPYTPD